MSRGARVRQADLVHAVKALDAAGFSVAAIEVRAGGVVRVVPGPRKMPGALTPAAAAEPDAGVGGEAEGGDDLARWRAERASRAAQGA